MMDFKTFQNVPLKIILKEDRVKQGVLKICQGGCNRLSKISNTIYQTRTQVKKKHSEECFLILCSTMSTS